MKNINLEKLQVVEMEHQDTMLLNGGESGSKNGAYIAGQVVGILLLACFPAAAIAKLIAG
jgi:hypothetical protein